MKTMVKMFVAIMAFALVLFAFAGCNFTPDTAECEHAFSEATCEAPKTCTLCGVTEGEALTHAEEELASKDATCTEAGLTEGRKCSACGEILVAQEEIPALGHTEEILVGKDATCTEAGLTDGKKCSVCDEILVAQEEIPALGHTEEVLNGEAPTCTETGLTDGKKCSVCYEILVMQEEIPMAAHIEEVIAGKPATCTETGLTDGKKCSACGEVLVAQEEIPVVAHSEEVIAGKAATCTETGLTDGKKCAVCGVTLAEQEIIPASGHKDEDNNFECDICFADLCIDHLPAEAVEENRIEPTCTAKGSYDLVVKCSQCGEEISREVKEISELPHEEENVAGKAPTCTEAGLTDGKKCAVCGKTLVAQEEIPMASHTEEGVAGKAPTCTETGLTDGKKCAVCGVTLVAQEEIPMASHTEEIIAGKCATCTEAGLTEGKKCSACGETLVAQEEIPAGHNIVDGACTACGYIPNVFAGKQFVASADASANMYSATYGYQTITDGIIFEEAKGRYSSKHNGGKIEATIDLGAIYELDEFKVYLYWNDGVNRFGSGLTIQVLFAGEWTTVIDCKTVEELQAYWVDNPDSVDKEWLVFDLAGVVAKQVKFTIPGQTSVGWSTFYEMECSARPSAEVEPEPEEPVYVENIFAGKTFTPTSDALASVLSASWWKGSGYEGLTDGIKNADNAPGRFSTIMKTTGMMDATIDLGGSYELDTLKFYTYDPAAGTGAASLGASLLIQIYADGEWKDVVVCADNATLASYLVVNEGTYNDYLEFNLGGVKAEKVRIYISASASASGTTYEEIICSGYQK